MEQLFCFKRKLHDLGERMIYDDTTCGERLLRRFLPFDWAINFRDCISNSMPNVFRFADQITDIIGNIHKFASNELWYVFWVFILFQRKDKLVTKLLSLIIFILAWIGGGIRWFVSLRKIKVGSNETTLRKIFLLLYIIPIFGIPCNFLSDLYTSAILTILRPKYLHTMSQPQ